MKTYIKSAKRLVKEGCQNVGCQNYPLSTTRFGKNNRPCHYFTPTMVRKCDGIRNAAKQWLKDNQKTEAKMNIEEKDGDYIVQLKERTEPKKPKTKREYLLELASKMGANKKEFNKTIDRSIEETYEKLCCSGCYVHIDGDYIFEKNLSVEKSIEVAEFINRMEADFE